MKAMPAVSNIYSITAALVSTFSFLFLTGSAAIPTTFVFGQEVRDGASQDPPRSKAKIAYADGERLRRQGTAESLRKAIGKYDEALRYFRALGDRKGEASTLGFLGITYNLLGEKQQAFEVYNKALSLWRVLSNYKEEAAVLDHIGMLYESLGEKQKALEYFNQALPLTRIIGNRARESTTLINIGRISSSLGDKQRALECFNQALAIRRASGDMLGVSSAFHHIGMIYYSLGEERKALEYFNQALAIRQAHRERRGEASTLNSMGRTYTVQGEKQKALECFNRALAIRQAVGDKSGEAATLSEVARLTRDGGDLTTARRQIEESINIVESLRTKVSSPELRASYFASVQSYYEFYIDLLMQLNRLYPALGYAVAALQASESARARSLLEILAEPRARLREGVDPLLLEREHLLLQQLNTKIEEQIRLVRDQDDPERANAGIKEIQALATEHEQAQAQIRAKSSSFAGGMQPIPLGLKQIQQLLDPDTLLLEYALGEERSYLWLVTSTSMNTYALPQREEIERAAGAVIRLLTEGGASREFETKAAGLSQILLDPIASQLGKKRLAIVADGLLQYIPFAALPLPRSYRHRTYVPTYIPLIVDHEVVGLPSASALAAIRNQLTKRKPAPRSLAILADPVFSKGDQRVKGGPVEDATTGIKPGLRSWRTGERERPRQGENPRSTRQVELFRDQSNWSRLPFSRREAEQILALVSAPDARAALDFDASQATALSAELSQYRILHFATHGVFSDEEPELSGLVLSLINEKGEPQDGFLSLSEVSNLNLTADLVVLSACRTGLGKQIRGEGLLGLTRGFMSAGAPRIVASLWAVQDRATLELMVRFYRAMMKRKLHPAGALREAQVSMWREGRWNADQWAGFVFQGEWH